MKMKLVLAALLIVLLNTGSSCINDGFLVAVNMPISHTWAINSGTGAFGGDAYVKFQDQIDESYRDKVKGARYYDIRVSVAGNYTGNVSGVVSINDKPIFNITDGPWSDFKTPQSLLGSSPRIQTQSGGLAELVKALNNFSVDPATQVKLTANGSAHPGPYPSGTTLTVEILAQVDAQVGGGDTSQ